MEIPQIGRVIVPEHWHAIDVISDLHLDTAHPKTFAAWRSALLDTPADAVFLLGDVFEAWVGDDARFEGFERECADVLKAATARRTVAFMVGNRDFLVGDALLADCGVQALADPSLLSAWGQTVLLTHGDALCLDDTDYQRFRAMVRNPAWQQAFLARPLVERRAIARQLRDASEANKATQSSVDWADVDRDTAVAWLRAAGAKHMLHGHTHRPGSETLAAGFTRDVLSDWDLDIPAARAEVLRLTRDGFARLAPRQAQV